MTRVNDVYDHLRHCSAQMQELTAILDHENAMMLFEGGEHIILRDTARQETKHALYAKFETMARVIIGIAKSGGITDRAIAHEVAAPIVAFRRSLRINTLLLETYLERQEARLEGILALISNDIAERQSCH